MSKPLDQLQDYFRADYRGAVTVYLFGSTARSTDSQGSDIDIGVLYREPPPRSLDAPSLSMKGDIEATLHRPVDVVVLNHASADLCHRVFRDGILVLDRDRAFRIRFEDHLRQEPFHGSRQFQKLLSRQDRGAVVVGIGLLQNKGGGYEMSFVEAFRFMEIGQPPVKVRGQVVFPEPFELR